VVSGLTLARPRRSRTSGCSTPSHGRRALRLRHQPVRQPQLPGPEEKLKVITVHNSIVLRMFMCLFSVNNRPVGHLKHWLCTCVANVASCCSFPLLYAPLLTCYVVQYMKYPSA
jgi:hypothetical protein